MLRAAAAALLLASAAGAAATPRRHVDPDAIRDARRSPDAGRWASARAISHYLEARRRARAGDNEKAVEQLRLAVAYDEESAELRVSLAEALAITGRLDAAEVEARRALELTRGEGPAASDAQVLLGRVAASRHQPELAIVALRQAIRIEGAIAVDGEPPDPEPWRLLAGVYLDAGEEEAAVRTLDDLAAHVPGDGTGFRELGRAYLAKKEPGRAERHLRRAVQLAPRDVEAYRLLAQAHEALRRDAEAKEDLLAVLRSDADDAATLIALGRIAVRQHDVPQGREWFHRYVRASADATDAHLRVVFQWLEGNDAAEALSAARAAIADAGPDPRLRFAEGISLAELRRWREAAEALSAVRPDAGEVYLSARVALAEALSRAGRHRDAERALDRSRSANGNDARILMTRASVLERAGRSGDAVALLRRAVAERERAGKGADLPDLYAALGDGLVHAGKPADAVSALRRAIAARPGDETLLYALGSAYEHAGQADAAIAQMRALLAINPDHAEAMNFVGYSLAEQGVRLEEAERLVRRALELKPRSGHVLDSLGWVLFRRGDVRRAVEALEEADRLSGPDATILEHLGDAYRAAARHADAANAYRRALGSVGEEIPAEQGRRRASIEKKLREVTASSAR